jgi:hypothetical protein
LPIELLCRWRLSVCFYGARLELWYLEWYLHSKQDGCLIQECASFADSSAEDRNDHGMNCDWRIQGANLLSGKGAIFIVSCL